MCVEKYKRKRTGHVMKHIRKRNHESEEREKRNFICFCFVFVYLGFCTKKERERILLG
jgi:hypothetical protein